MGRTDAEALILWPPAASSQLIGKDPDGGKDRRQQEKRVTEDKMVGWHQRYNGHELGQTLGDDKGHRSLGCCSPWGSKELDTTRQPNNNNNNSPKATQLLKGGVESPSRATWLQSPLFTFQPCHPSLLFCSRLFPWTGLGVGRESIKGKLQSGPWVCRSEATSSGGSKSRCEDYIWRPGVTPLRTILLSASSLFFSGHLCNGHQLPQSLVRIRLERWGGA